MASEVALAPVPAITGILPAQEKYVSSTGPTKAAVAGQNVTFGKVASLAPKDQVVYKITVKAVAKGDVRFKVTMHTDQLALPVEHTEATHIYQQ